MSGWQLSSAEISPRSAWTVGNYNTSGANAPTAPACRGDCDLGTKRSERQGRTLFIVTNLLLTVAFIPLVTLIPLPSRATILHVGGTGAENYSSIWSAIYAADPGDIVYVHRGFYSEGVVIDKRVSLIGEDRSSTIIQGHADLGECWICVHTDSVRIANLTLRNSSYLSHGLALSSVRDITLENINFEKTSIAITGDKIEHWNTHHIDTSNTVDGKPIYYWKNLTGGTIPSGAGEVILANTKYVSIQHQEFSESTNSIEVGFSSFNTIAENVLNLTMDDNIHLFESDNNTIIDNEIAKGDIGIHLQSSDGNFIIDNHGLCYMCLWLESSHNNTLSRNRLDGSPTRPSFWGIFIENSNHTVMTDNELNSAGILVDGSMLENWNTHAIDSLNTINGKPLYYWRNVDGGTVPTGAGEVILANATNVTVEGQNVSNGSAGIQVGYSKGVRINGNILSEGNTRLIRLYRSTQSTISNNTAVDNGISVGIDVEYSDNNTIAYNLMMNSPGIRLQHSMDNTIANNTVFAEWGDDVSLLSSNRNLVVGNTATRGGLGLLDSDDNIIRNNAFSHVFLHGSNGNTVYHNDVFDQGSNPSEDSAGTNAWDNGYPSGGNYWAFGNFNDSMSGPGQDQSGGDGIADQPVSIPYGSSMDRYPLMQIRGPPPFLPLAPRKLNCSTNALSVNLRWDAPFFNGTWPVIGYRIYRAVEYEQRELIAELGNVRTYTDVNVEPGTFYHYSISAVNYIGEGPPTDRVLVTIPAITGSNGLGDENLRQALIWAGAALTAGLVSIIAIVLLLRSRRKKGNRPETEGHLDTHDDQADRP